MARRPCSVSLAELFTEGLLTESDVLPNGLVSDETRARAERRYGVQRPLVAMRAPPSPAIVRDPVFQRTPSTLPPPPNARFERRMQSLSPVTPPLGVPPTTCQGEDPTLPSAAPPCVRGLRCCVCMDGLLTHLALPCSHLCVCDACYVRLFDCPVCRTPVQQFRRVYIAGAA